MATLGTNGKNASLTGIVGAIDGGSGNGYMEIGTTSFASILGTLPLSKPCGTVSGGVLTLATPFSDSAANAAGTAAVARVKDSAGNIIIASMTVGTSGTEVILSSTTIALAQPMNITSATLTYA